MRSNWEMGASFWSSKVGCASDLSGSYKNFVMWAFLSFWVWVFFFSFSFSFFLFSEERNATKTDRLIDPPTDRRTTYKPYGWMDE
jgi:hypothetical protein